MRTGVAMLALLVAGVAHAEPRGVIVDYGEVTAKDAGPMPPGQELHALSPGRTVGDMKFTRRTDRIEATLCRRFGVAMHVLYAPGDLPVGQVLVRVRHPPMQRPDGVTGDEDSFYTTPDGSDVATAFTFDEGWEAVPGQWVWEFSAGGKVLATQAFTVTPPDEAVAPRSSCEGPPLS